MTHTTSILTFSDYIGAIRMRLGYGRTAYTVEPGLYSLGNPGKKSQVFASANYKLSFDTLRKNLTDTDCYILVLDTKGINVWCAAGKGTFGTDELIRQIKASSLKDIVSHRRIIVPQLGAPGVAAHEVRKKTGFSVDYGPVRAADIKEFIQTSHATETMRTVQFGFWDRIVLIPVELKGAQKIIAAAALICYLLSGINAETGTFINIAEGSRIFLNVLAGFFAGIFLSPALLPWLPGRSFSAKGIAAGIITSAILYFSGSFGSSIYDITGYSLIICALSSFFSMNFTGCSTYTSLSGVTLEMKRYIPVQLIMLLTGIILLIISLKWGTV